MKLISSIALTAVAISASGFFASAVQSATYYSNGFCKFKKIGQHELAMPCQALVNDRFTKIQLTWKDGAVDVFTGAQKGYVTDGIGGVWNVRSLNGSGFVLAKNDRVLMYTVR